MPKNPQSGESSHYGQLSGRGKKLPLGAYQSAHLPKRLTIFIMMVFVFALTFAAFGNGPVEAKVILGIIFASVVPMGLWFCNRLFPNPKG